jgi:hypothetical protein
MEARGAFYLVRSNMIIWDIDTLERDPATGRVTVAHWRAKKLVGDTVAETYGAVELLPGSTDPTDPEFRPFSDLTKGEVVEWVVAALSAPAPTVPGAELPTQLADVEAYLDARIAEQLAPPVVTGTPW